MNRNVESHFATLPHANIARSRFDRSFTHKTTMDAGKLVPIFVDEVLPGDTFQMDTSMVARMSTPVYPVMDNCYLDYYFFFVPNRLTWVHWQEFCGENSAGVWAQETEYLIPQLVAPDETGFAECSLADYMGIPTKVPGLSVNALPFRAYVLIWNEFFRDQNVMIPAYFEKDDADRTGMAPVETSFEDSANSALYGGSLLPVAKYHDYFTSCLPAPQKGEAVRLPWSGDPIPVDTGSEEHDTNEYTMRMNGAAFEIAPGTPPYPQTARLIAQYDRDTGKTFLGWSNTGETPGEYSPVVVTPEVETVGGIKPSNLYAYPQNSYMATINELRLAFQVQKLLERDARGGTRYIEMLKSHFGVTSPDSRLQRPEYLGGARIPVNMDQVLQTSATDAVSPQGNTAAYSLTSDARSNFTQSFTEHGYVIGLACIRTDHTYQQGLERFWSRTRRFDYYWPVLANIGEMAVLNKEIYAQGDNEQVDYKDNDAFGYQEAWADYRYKPSRVSGAFRSNHSGSLDSWHYADDFSDPVYLSNEFIAEGKQNIDRTLAVTSQLANQFIIDIYFKFYATRPMPLYSVPGLLDHN